MQNRKLPVGIQDFETIRMDGYVYVDKTQYIWNMAENGKPYFLGRPRRFGKSLLISTMEAYFRGKKELFEGLAISRLEAKRGEEAWQEYPVIRFSLSGGNYHSADGLANTLKMTLLEAEEQYEIGQADLEHIAPDLPNRLRYDIRKIYEKKNRRVVVLVDEYDKPLLETMGEEQEKKNRDLYKGFFSVLKDQDKYLKFVFFTGVTKFSKVSIFSDLNQPDDISLTNEYSALCGITGEELLNNFQPEIEAMAQALKMTRSECLAKLARTYDGYHFSTDAEGVYNPFSLLNALKKGSFDRYWFETGTPTFLITQLQHSSFRPEQLADGVESTEAELKDYRPENPNPVPLFYQAGYLTIAGYDKEFNLYTLTFPNEEVRYGFLNSLVPYVLGEKTEENPYSARAMVLAMRKGDTERLEKQLYALFASIPYMEGKAPDYESVWRNQIYLVFALLGEYVECEQHTAKGRCDCVVQTSDYIYIFEFKVDQAAQEALDQIDRKDYAGRFYADRRKLFRIGVNFSSKERNIIEWKVQ